MQLVLNQVVVATNPAVASGLKNYLSLSADLGVGVVRVALFHANGSWEVSTPTVGAAAADFSILLADDIRKVSVQLTSVADNAVVGFDLLSTLTPAGA